MESRRGWLHLKPGAKSPTMPEHTLLSMPYEDLANLLRGKKTLWGVNVWVNHTV